MFSKNPEGAPSRQGTDLLQVHESKKGKRRGHLPQVVHFRERAWISHSNEFTDVPPEFADWQISKIKWFDKEFQRCSLARQL